MALEAKCPQMSPASCSGYVCDHTFLEHRRFVNLRNGANILVLLVHGVGAVALAASSHSIAWNYPSLAPPKRVLFPMSGDGIRVMRRMSGWGAWIAEGQERQLRECMDGGVVNWFTLWLPSFGACRDAALWEPCLLCLHFGLRC